MAKVNKSLINTPVEDLVGNPSTSGTKGAKAPVVPNHPRSGNSGVPEKQMEDVGYNKNESFQPDIKINF
jgi:hypothetical protein